MPGSLKSEYNEKTKAETIIFQVDAKKLKSSDKVIVSPAFSLLGVEVSDYVESWNCASMHRP